MNTPAIQEPMPKLPEDLASLSSDDRISYILEVRRRVQVDKTSVSDDEIRDAVRLIRLNRAEPNRRKATASAKPPAKKVTLADF